MKKNEEIAAQQQKQLKTTLQLILSKRDTVKFQNAGIAQLVERNLAKVEVESSRLFSRSNLKKGSNCFPFFSKA